jgi:hypothetical protein
VAKKRVFLPYVRPCTLLLAVTTFGCNALIYQQLARLLRVLALFPASALGQVTSSTPRVSTTTPSVAILRVWRLQFDDVRRSVSRTRNAERLAESHRPFIGV